MYAETLQNTAKSSSGLLGNAAASIEVGLLDAELCPASTPWSWYSAFDWSKMNCIISDQFMCHDVSNLYITILKTSTIDAVVTIMRIYTLQIQNRRFSRVCSNTGVHTKNPRFSKTSLSLELYCCLEFHARSSPACRCGLLCLFPGKAHRFLHSWPWVGWYNHAFLHITSSNFQKVMCFLPMPLSKSRSNVWKSSEISTI